MAYKNRKPVNEDTFHKVCVVLLPYCLHLCGGRVISYLGVCYSNSDVHVTGRREASFDEFELFCRFLNYWSSPKDVKLGLQRVKDVRILRRS
jgi:hypothetical protein